MSEVLVSIQNLKKTFGNQQLFDGLTLGIHKGEKLGLIGPNGSGKSTLLKILAGQEDHEAGELSVKNNLHLAYVAQSENLNDDLSVEESIVENFTNEYDENKHTILNKADRLIQFPDQNQKVGDLSGGWKKRLSILRSILKNPDLILLDEPTNHLDLEGIFWLEQLLTNSNFSYILISHDRYFLEKVTNRIIEINKQYPDGFFKTEGTYSDFLEKREKYLDELQIKERTLANKVRREVEWLMRGPKARTTKAQYRIDKAHSLQSDLKDVRELQNNSQKTNIDFSGTDKKSKVLVEVENLTHSFNQQPLFADLSFKLGRKEILGVIGNNGSGKSTLINLMNGTLKPQSGRVDVKSDIQIVTFDQKRENLDKNQLLSEALSPSGGDKVIFQNREIHIVGWAKRFLFNPDKLNFPVSKLSGGEQARILIANLMLKPADVLILDEPTNDLDIQTLEVLEESLSDFLGTIVLISHDRFLMNRLASKILYLDGAGKTEFFEDYEQWLSNYEEAKKTQKKEDNNTSKSAEKSNKISYQQKKELGKLERKIEKLESFIDELQKELQDPSIQSDPVKLATIQEKIDSQEEELLFLYEEKENINSGT